MATGSGRGVAMERRRVPAQALLKPRPADIFFAYLLSPVPARTISPAYKK